jgi:hypothetical protein
MKSYNAFINELRSSNEVLPQELEEQTVHVVPHGTRGTHFKVVKGIKGQLDKGEVIHDSHIDDLKDVGIHVKVLKEEDMTDEERLVFESEDVLELDDLYEDDEQLDESWGHKVQSFTEFKEHAQDHASTTTSHGKVTFETKKVGAGGKKWNQTSAIVHDRFQDGHGSRVSVGHFNHTGKGASEEGYGQTLGYFSESHDPSQVDELNREQLVSYIHKGATSAAQAGQKFGKALATGDLAAKDAAERKARNRRDGMTKAAARLAYHFKPTGEKNKMQVSIPESAPDFNAPERTEEEEKKIARGQLHGDYKGHAAAMRKKHGIEGDKSKVLKFSNMEKSC